MHTHRKALTTAAAVAALPILLAATACAENNNGEETDRAAEDAAAEYYAERYGNREERSGKQFKTNQDWWPEQLDLSPLRQHSPDSNPYGDDFDYAEAFSELDLDEVKADIEAILTDSQDWWPADWGHYGPLMIRMAWHSAGTYRIHDGRGGAVGGQQRFDPLRSWPDNANLDRAQRLLWPVKQKYGRSLSWSDLMILTGNVALESMGFETAGFAGGREDDWESDLVYWGPEKGWLDDERVDEEGKLDDPFGATQMGLIYVNPEGPGGEPDPIKAADRIRQTFNRMAMNDEEIVALIAGGHTFGKAHGAVEEECVGELPGGADLELQGFGWDNECGTGKGADAFTSGLEGAWSASPTAWTSQFFDNLFGFEWEKTESPAGGIQWEPVGDEADDLVPDAHDPDERHAPIMFTTDLALKRDPDFREISERFHEDMDEFEDAFARAWFKLTHRDMGPRDRYLGNHYPEEDLIWQDPIPEVDHELIDEDDIDTLKAEILDTGLDTDALIRVAWGSAASFRISDRRGGANGARIRLEPQNEWEVNNPDELERVLSELEGIQEAFNQDGDTRVSLADLIVLGGAAAIEQAAAEAGHEIEVPFTPGRMDATAEQTDKESFDVLEPHADGFRNFYNKDKSRLAPTEALVNRAALLDLTVPQMTALLGGMRTLGANAGDSDHGVLTENTGRLDNDFFVNLLDMSTEWSQSDDHPGVYEGHERGNGELKWTATPVDLIFGHHAELRAVAEVYGSNDGEEKLIEDFVDAWTKVMNLDRSGI